MVCERFNKCIIENCSDSSERCRKCRKESKDSNIASSENGKRYNLRNDRECKVINFLIDGGVYIDEISLNKCDRLYYIKDTELSSVIFIEFKGKDVAHALEQVYSTAHKYKKEFDNSRKCFRIICSGVPRIANDKKCVDIKKKIYSEFNAIPIIKERVIDESYSNLK